MNPVCCEPDPDGVVLFEIWHIIPPPCLAMSIIRSFSFRLRKTIENGSTFDVAAVAVVFIVALILVN